MTTLQLADKLWIADLHDLDQVTRNHKTLIFLKTYHETLFIQQKVVFAKSYRKRSPMVTVEMSTQGYQPSSKDLAHVLNMRSCYQSPFTILAGSYWENEIKNQAIIKFYDTYLSKDPIVIEHRDFHNKELNNNDSKDSWSWKQPYSNFPFLMFTTEEPNPRQLFLSHREEVDCLLSWTVNQSHHTIGKAFFLPYGVPDMLGEAGIAVFRNSYTNSLMGLYMCERLRDTLITEDCKKYRTAQEKNVPEMLMFKKSASTLPNGACFSQGDNLKALPDDWEDDFDDSEGDLTPTDSDELSSDEFFETDSEDEVENCSQNDGIDSNIVEYASKGYYSLVRKEILRGKVDINISNESTDFEGKWGDTALIAATRNCHFDIVLDLLRSNADPTLESFDSSGDSRTALKVASECLQLRELVKEDILHLKYSEVIEPSDPEAAALDFLYRIKCFQDIIDVLKIGESFWPKVSYFSTDVLNGRNEKLKNSPNKPTNERELREKLIKFEPKPLDKSTIKPLADAIVQIRKKDERETSRLFLYMRNNMCALNAYCSERPATVNCQHGCCVRCCPGPCKTHGLRTEQRVFAAQYGSSKVICVKQDLIPYNTTFRSPMNSNFDVFAVKNMNWDDEKSEEFILSSGEEICVVHKKRMFDTPKNNPGLEKNKLEISLNLTYAYGVLIAQNSSYNYDYDSEGDRPAGTCGRFHKLVGSPTTEIINRKIRDYQLQKCQEDATGKPIPIEVLSEGYTFAMVTEDPSLKVLVTDSVSFGDFKDAQNKQPQKVSASSKANVNTVRHFKPGLYHVSVLKPVKDCDPFVMYHHESIDPQKLMDQILLMTGDYRDRSPGVDNVIDGEDWCEWRNWDGSFSRRFQFVSNDHGEARKNEEFAARNIIYFCPTESAGLLERAVEERKTIKSKVFKKMGGVLDGDANVIALAVKTARMNSTGNWI
ncbi:uncharacterized protein [Clytia hemisphaerica]|uniref:Uncharacterized protein n=1 Tax=Clytia hemisphaerica TaxID=252671 RepID=A0A7M5UIS6_9CNID